MVKFQKKKKKEKKNEIQNEKKGVEKMRGNTSQSIFILKFLYKLYCFNLSAIYGRSYKGLQVRNR